MGNLLFSGNSTEIIEWDIDDVLLSESSVHHDRARMTDYGWDCRISRSGMTYLEIEQFDNTYNNFN